MRYIEGINRDQLTLFPDQLDNYISEENPIRFVDVFVEGLDLKELGFERARPKQTGRPGYHPATLLKLYIYGYLNRVQSSRRLETESQRNVELMWLLSRLTPDFKTIADFRKDNKAAIQSTCREFTLLCQRLDLFSRELIAVDGSKFKAVNNPDKNFTPERLKLHIQRIDEDINRFLTRMSQTDRDEQSFSQVSAAGLQQKIQRLEQEKVRLGKLQKQLKTSGDMQLSLSDPDARVMATRKRGSKVVGYNVQSAVEADNHFIVAHEVTNAVTDKRQLYNISSQAKASVEADELDVVADSGYYTGDEVLGCLHDGITPYVPKTYTSRSKNLGRFGKQDFVYRRDEDVYICPAGKPLSYRFATIEKDREIRYYSTDQCATCQLKAQCTTARQRRITRWVEEDVMDDMEAALLSDPDKMKLRKSTVEHPFGTIKSWMGSTHFLMKGLPKVKTEMALHVMAYNIKRAVQVLDVQSLVEAVA